MRNALADNAAKLSVLTREDCLKLLRRTARLTAEYLVRPQHFLGKYLYAESYELKVEALSAMLEPFVEYAYLSEVLRKYLAKKQIESLPEERFEKLISEIDKKVCATYSPAEWAHLLEPLCDFYFLGGEAKVPISELQLFLREKDALAPLSLLTQLREHGIDAIAKDDMIWLFEGDITPLLRKRKTIKVSPEFEETLMSHLSRNLLDENLLNAIQIDDTETQNVSESTPQTLADATTPKVGHASTKLSLAQRDRRNKSASCTCTNAISRPSIKRGCFAGAAYTRPRASTYCGKSRKCSNTSRVCSAA